MRSFIDVGLVVVLVVGLSSSCDNSSQSAETTPSWLFVVSSDSAIYAGSWLTLQGTDPRVLLFNDRPARKVRRVSLEGFIRGWPQAFGDDPPNAAFSCVDNGEERIQAVELSKPVLSSAGLQFDVAVLGKEATVLGTPGAETFDLPANCEHVSVFIDQGDYLYPDCLCTEDSDCYNCAGTNFVCNVEEVACTLPP